MQVGDYVIDKVAEVVGLDRGILIIKDIDNGVSYCENIVGEKEIMSLPDENLRPAVLADWAKEIPEKYQQWYSVITMNNPKYVIMTAREDSACVDMVIFEDIESIKYNRQTEYIGRYVADALSAHYGIPIMPYEQYKKIHGGSRRPQ